MYIRKCDILCRLDVIIRLGDDDVIINLGNVRARCLNDVYLNDRRLKFSNQDAQITLLLITPDSLAALVLILTVVVTSRQDVCTMALVTGMAVGGNEKQQTLISGPCRFHLH